MRETRLYLDHNASAPLLREARDAIVAALDVGGNPSSVHAEGRAVRSLMAKARAEVAALARSQGDAVVFTSGATEAASTCLTPRWVRDGCEESYDRLAVIDTDHPCIREGGRFAPGQITRLPVDANGILRLGALAAWLGQGAPGVVAFCAANSETGVVQPIREIVAMTQEAGSITVADCVQMAGRYPLKALALGADALILSAHKLGGPKGVGAFVLASTNLRPVPLLTGGAQETRQRAGTEAAPLIAGFGAAARIAKDRVGEAARLVVLRERLESGILSLSDGFRVLGSGAERLPQTAMFHHPALRAETVQIAMDLAGIAVSAGSACSSGKVGGSFVLDAMARGGAEIAPDMGGLRVSFGPETDVAGIDRFLVAFRAYWARTGSDLSTRHVA